MDDDVGFGSQSIKHNLVAETGACKVELGVGERVLDVLQAAGGEVVESEDAVSAGQKRVDEMRTDETGGAGDEPGSRFTNARTGSVSAFRHVYGQKPRSRANGRRVVLPISRSERHGRAGRGTRRRLRSECRRSDARAPRSNPSRTSGDRSPRRRSRPRAMQRHPA